MANRACEGLRNVKPGRTEWKVKVRIIREWRGMDKKGQPFKGFNLLLLDAKNCRMQAWVPSGIENRMSKLIQLGKIYVLKDFQVKSYTEQDKFRPVQIDRQITFTNDTKVKQLDESEVFIPQNMFDIFPFDDLHGMSKQVAQLIDVVGIMQTKPTSEQKPSKNGKIQTQIKFKLTDGKTEINVTFWDMFAELFERSINEDLEEPIIIIIASGRVTNWHDQIDVCNYSPTMFYLNYDHHSVIQLRKLLKQSDFFKTPYATKRKTFKDCTVAEIYNLSTDFIEDEVICKLTINKLEENQKCTVSMCTSCYTETVLEGENHCCPKCPRIVLQPLKRFKLSIVASDKSGCIHITLLDREVRTILGKNAFQVDSQDNILPFIMKNIQARDYTIKLLMKEDNILKKSHVYEATGIFLGFNREPTVLPIKNTIPHSPTATTEASGSSYHLDEISQLNYETS